jgi:phenylpropionate dioxygenase-like ring-hydroxylating dioxygenase large terminal subunit
MNFGQIHAVAVKDVWPGEATDFTPWLAKNLDVLSDALGMELILEATEASAGDFSADIVARDQSTNRIVVIENQFGSTDHRHLGQIITYSSVLGAQAVVWIAETVRAEHKAAINFLNQNLKEGLQLYALEVGVIRIDDSKPAYTFSPVCVPVEGTVVLKGKETTETNQRYQAYFQMLVDEMRTQHQFTNANVGMAQSWYTFTSEKSRVFTYCASFAQRGRVRVEVYIDCRDKEKNEAIFDELLVNKEEIERLYGTSLSWERLDSRRGCRIAAYRDGSIDSSTEELEEVRKWTVQQLLQFKRVLPSYILNAYNSAQ